MIPKYCRTLPCDRTTSLEMASLIHLMCIVRRWFHKSSRLGFSLGLFFEADVHVHICTHGLPVYFCMRYIQYILKVLESMLHICDYVLQWLNLYQAQNICECVQLSVAPHTFTGMKCVSIVHTHKLGQQGLKDFQDVLYIYIVEVPYMCKPLCARKQGVYEYQ